LPAARALATLRTAGKGGGRRFLQKLEPVRVDADPTRVDQILGNLLGNALKFTAEGATITVSTGVERGEAVLRVADNGIGMPAELAARVFEPFVQGARPLDRSQGGLGIGLTLVRRLAELHGGMAEGHSDGDGRGSVFTVRLPAISAPGLAVSRGAKKETGKARDILVVEDNPDARDTLKRLLESLGHRVRVAPDGVEALEQMRAAPPEIALVDVGLPRMDGYELARRVVKELKERKPYLVAVTGYGLPEDRERTLEAGFDLHLVKPVDMTALAEVLSR
jgi:two-component system, sensor histidine kinase